MKASPKSQVHTQVQATGSNSPSPPKAFLSYGSEDRGLAEKLATGLRTNGIETWWAEWEIRAGDSIRRKIDAGLGECTHFIVLLTANSIGRPWVNEEIDAGLVRKVDERCRFIPLRHGLSVRELPALLSGMLSPEIDASASNLKQLVDDIMGVSRKPRLGVPAVPLVSLNTGFSPAASKVAKLFVERSPTALFCDVQMMVEEIAGATGLTEPDLEDALDELKRFVTVSSSRVLPKDILYAEFDGYWLEWNPREDAATLAADLINAPDFPTDPREIAKVYDWTARRLNPAMTFLRERGAADLLEVVGSGPFITIRIMATGNTRRFLKSLN